MSISGPVPLGFTLRHTLRGHSKAINRIAWSPDSRTLASISAIVQPVILCGHSHVPRTVALPHGKLIVNPGSVGLPAYTMETPAHYMMESGSPHARYALLHQTQQGW